MLTTLETDKLMVQSDPDREIFSFGQMKVCVRLRVSHMYFWFTSNEEVKQNRPDEAWKGRLLLDRPGESCVCYLQSLWPDWRVLGVNTPADHQQSAHLSAIKARSLPGRCVHGSPACLNVTPILQHWRLYLESAVDSWQFFSSMRDQNQNRPFLLRSCWTEPLDDVS